MSWWEETSSHCVPFLDVEGLAGFLCMLILLFILSGQEKGQDQSTDPGQGLRAGLS